MNSESLLSPFGDGDYLDLFLQRVSALITGTQVGTGRFAGLNLYSWVEQQFVCNSIPVQYKNADGPRRGTFTSAMVLEKNNQLITPPFYADIRVIGSYLGDPIYEFEAGTGSSSGETPTIQSVAIVGVQTVALDSTATWLVIASSGGILAGLVGGVPNRPLLIQNAGPDPLTILNVGLASQTGKNVVLQPGDFVYARWNNGWELALPDYRMLASATDISPKYGNQKILGDNTTIAVTLAGAAGTEQALIVSAIPAGIVPPDSIFIAAGGSHAAGDVPDPGPTAHTVPYALCDDAMFHQLVTTKGDLLGTTGSAYGRLGVGTDGYILISDSTQALGLSWQPSTTAFDLSVGLDSAGFTVSNVDIIQFDHLAFNASGTSPAIDVVLRYGGASDIHTVGTDGAAAAGTSHKVAAADHVHQAVVFGAAGGGHSIGVVPDPSSTQHIPPYVLGSDAVWYQAPAQKGDLWSSTGTVFGDLAVGADNSLLIADASQPLGLKWGGGAVAGVVGGFLQWVKVVVNYNDSWVNVAALTATHTILTLPAAGVLHAIKMWVPTAWTGLNGPVPYYGYSGGAGMAAATDNYYGTTNNAGMGTPAALPGFSTTQMPDCENQGAVWNVTLKLVSSGGNLSTLTAGELDVWLLVSLPPA